MKLYSHLCPIRSISSGSSVNLGVAEVTIIAPQSRACRFGYSDPS